MRRYLPYLAPLMLVLMLVVACEGGIVNLSGDLVSRAAFESGCDYVDADTARIWVNAADAGWADVHYRVNSGGQLNVRMNREGTYFWYDVNGLSEGDVIDYWFTIGFNAGAQDTGWYSYTHTAGGSTPTPTPPPSGDWVLIWSDEFEGSSLDTSNWTPEIGGSGWGNNELEYYTDRPENIQVSGGYLQIIARRESYGGMNYTSARLKTENKVYHTYGRIEARIRLSRIGMGLWPAFWMLGNNFSQVSWPACGEIDIMEHINTEDVVYGTIHWDAGGYASYGGNISPVDVTQWHVYSIEWDASSIKWFVDGVQYHEANIENSINSTEEFHRPFFILLNVAIGGNWPGFTIDDSIFPVTMYVDWVRWYQR